ncbi:MAG: amino acid permease [Eggerthellaceae bacterium]|nr:amino acid permease [Eggerthellaceae bacterium]
MGTSLASGVFSLSGDFAQNGSSTLATLIGWGITCVGMLGLTLCFYKLVIIKPKIKSGIYSYARSGFGEYVGFNSAWGYWLSAIICVVSYLYLVMETLGHYIPVFNGEDLFLQIFASVVVIWFFTLLILRSDNQVIYLSALIVLVKCLLVVVVPLAIILCGSFDFGIFIKNFAGDGSMPLLEQVKGTLTLTVWIFIGIEGTVVISGRAKKSEDVGRSTLLTFGILFVLYFLISFLSMGVMPSEDLAVLPNPSLGGVLSYVTGTEWGGILVDISLIISVGGALFSWLVLAVYSMYVPAKGGSFPKILAVKNKFNSPHWSVILTAIAISLLIIFAFVSNSSFQICYTFSTITIIIPYVLCAFYMVKLIFRGSIKYTSQRDKYATIVIGIVAFVYSLWMLYAPGIDYLIMSSALYLPGTILYISNCKSRGKRVFNGTVDVIVFGAILLVFAASIPCFLRLFE